MLTDEDKDHASKSCTTNIVKVLLRHKVRNFA